MENNNYSEDYVVEEEKKFKITRGMVILGGIILGVIIVLIIIIIGIINATKPKYTKADFTYLETRMKDASSTYIYKTNKTLTSESTKIELDNLLIKNKGDIDPSKVVAAKICDGFVMASLDQNEELYKPYIKCIYKNKVVYKTDGYDSLTKKATTKKSATVKDTEKPVITLNGAEEITINLGQDYIEQGATAMDNIDGDITSKIKTSGKVDNTKEGTYRITYIVSDKAGNRSEKVRKIEVIEQEEVVTTTYQERATTRATTKRSGGGSSKVVTTRNTTPPTIVLKGSNYITINLGGTYSEPGYAAKDSKGNDITGSVSVLGSVNTSVSGKYIIKYSVTDSWGNTAVKQRTVKVGSDYVTLKSIQLTPNSVTLSVGKTKTVSVTYSPTNATNKSVSWSSSNTKVATVSNGTIKGVSKGSATITVKGADGVSTRLTVVVK